MPKKKASAKRKAIASKKQNSRPAHKRLMLNPLFGFIMLSIGVFLTLWTFHVSAVDIIVSARVAGVAPTVPATIDNPTDGATLTTSPVSVSGTCPLNSYVAIYSNNLIRGYALCTVLGDYSLSVSLISGQNELLAHVYNLADEEGPVSDPVNVFYDAPLPPTEPSAPGGGLSPSPATPSSIPNEVSDSLLISTEFEVRAFYAGEKVTWPLSITGGTAPYAINIDWGDGTNDVISRTEAGNFEISHEYTRPGADRDSFSVKVSASDSSGGTSFLQFFVFVTSEEQLISNSGNSSGILTKERGGLGGLIDTVSNNRFLAAAWPSFGVISLMTVSFWLGEKEGFWIIRRGPHLRG